MFFLVSSFYKFILYYLVSFVFYTFIFLGYNSYEEVQQAIQTLENKSAVNGPSSGDFKANGEEEEEESDDDEDDEEIDPNEEKALVDNENEEPEEESDEEGDNDDVDDSVSDQNASRMLASMRAAEEDEEFEKAFKNLMHHSVESVKALGSVKATTDMNRMAIPG